MFESEVCNGWAVLIAYEKPTGEAKTEKTNSVRRIISETLYLAQINRQ